MPRRAKNGGRGGGVGGNHTRGVGGLDPALHPGTRGSQSNVTCQSYYLSIICENCVEFSTARSVYLKSNARSRLPSQTRVSARVPPCAGTHITHQTPHINSHTAVCSLPTAQTAHTPLSTPRTRALTQTTARWTHSTARGYGLWAARTTDPFEIRKYVSAPHAQRHATAHTAQRCARTKSNEEAYCEANERAHLRLSLAQI